MFGELADWDGEEAIVAHDATSGSWMIVAVHSTVLGPAMGGTRMRSYPSPDDALRDGLRLASAMTVKQAAADLPYGGGKAVLAVGNVPPPGSAARRSLLLRYADLVASLGGTYVTAADMNTGAADMDTVFERCPHVLGRSAQQGGSGDPGADTAVGVLHAIGASVAHAFGSRDLDRVSVLVQGIGSVGRRLVELLTERGAEVTVADVDEGRAHATGRPVVSPGQVIETLCDVFAPCATGGVLSAGSIARLKCRIVAGAANNQLATSEDAARLQDAGILYAPDFVVNAGGVLHLAGYETLGWDGAMMAARLSGIADTLSTVFRTADAEGITTNAAAERLARDRIEGARARRAP